MNKNKWKNIYNTSEDINNKSISFPKRTFKDISFNCVNDLTIDDDSSNDSNNSNNTCGIYTNSTTTTTINDNKIDNALIKNNTNLKTSPLNVSITCTGNTRNRTSSPMSMNRNTPTITSRPTTAGKTTTETIENADGHIEYDPDCVSDCLGCCASTKSNKNNSLVLTMNHKNNLNNNNNNKSFNSNIPTPCVQSKMIGKHNGYNQFGMGNEIIIEEFDSDSNVSTDNEEIFNRNTNKFSNVDVTSVNLTQMINSPKRKRINNSIDKENSPIGDSIIPDSQKNNLHRIPFSSNYKTFLGKTILPSPPKQSIKYDKKHQSKQLYSESLPKEITIFENTIDEYDSSSDDDKDACTNVQRYSDQIALDSFQNRNSHVYSLSSRKYNPQHHSEYKLEAKPNGLLSKYQTILNKFKINTSFWQQERELNLNENGTLVQIEKIEKCYGRVIIQCTVDEQPTILIMDDHDIQRMKSISVGVFIELPATFNEFAHYKLNNFIVYTNFNQFLIK